MSLQKGDIVLVPFPFTDLSGTKLRPALVLWVDSTGNDVTLCFISSQNIISLSPEEFILDASDPDFAATGLKVSSRVKVTRIMTIERRLISRRLGKLGDGQIRQLNIVMIQAFELT
ncbi:MAG: type II toxin-antitoxin system PemK/MazF family toxin [Scytonema hyalinum WJT4-NPBG1]|jgi:mRNA interferase MazF|nr:type II toxin-antitoxin system PemK/MazF family toxin [Scytonema hyalinum WJT4-NPBG1]